MGFDNLSFYSKCFSYSDSLTVWNIPAHLYIPDPLAFWTRMQTQLLEVDLVHQLLVELSLYSEPFPLYVSSQLSLSQRHAVTCYQCNETVCNNVKTLLTCWSMNNSKVMFKLECIAGAFLHSFKDKMSHKLIKDINKPYPSVEMALRQIKPRV